MTPKQVLQRIRQENIRFVDLRFLDFPGTWQHFTLSASQLNERSFEEGFGFDGSSIRGWQAINEADMLVVPVAATAALDPFFEHPTLTMICDVKDPVTRKRYSRDPRSISRKASAYLRETGLADTAYFGPEVEFFVFDRVRFDQNVFSAVHELDSVEGLWNRGNASPVNFGRQVGLKQGQFPCPPTDTLQVLRSEMCEILEDLGIPLVMHHHEGATAGQCEIDLAFNEMPAMCDALMQTRYVVKQVAARHGKTATFMPKPLLDENGSGMHIHFSLWSQNENCFAGRRYGGLSETALHAIAGLLHHAPALAAFTNPTTNSYKRLVPGFEAPVHRAYSSRNRAAAIRVPVYNQRPETKRIELRWPDPSANPYLVFSAILMAAIDGIQRKLDPGDPIDQDLESLAPEALADLPQMPRTLGHALDALDTDRAFLTAGNVFPDAILDGWIDYKRRNEVHEIDRRPHPYEFCMYFDV